MRSQKCSKCGTLLDISRLEKGSKFACATCGAVLVVGEAAAVKRSLSEGPAFKPRAKKDEPSVPQRRRRKEPAAAPAPRRERRAAGDAPPAKSKVPLFAGIGALVVSGIVIAIVATRGGGEGPGGGGGGGRATAPGVPSAAKWWDSVSAKVGAADEQGLLDLLAEAESRGYTSDPLFWNPKALEIYQALLKRNRDSEKANRFYGHKSLRDYPEFDAIWAAMNAHYKVLPDHFRAFLSQHEAAIDSGKHVWLGDEDYAAQTAVLAQFAEWKKELEADPSAEQIEQALARAETFAKDFGAVAVLERPFLVLLASRQLRQADDSDAEKARLEGVRRGFDAKKQALQKALAVVAKVFDTRFREPLGLEPVPKDKVLRLWICDDLAAYQDLARNMSRGENQGQPPFFYFSPRTRWAYGYYPEDPAQAEHVIEDIAATAVQQLQWHYSRDPAKPFADYFQEWNGWWFTIGLAEYAGGGLSESGGAYTFTGFHPRAVAQLKKLKENGWPLFPLRELVAQRTQQSYGRYWADVFFPTLTSDDDLPDAVLDTIRAEPPGFPLRIFYAQAWYLAYFLNEYENGKYRKQYLDLLMAALRGRMKPAAYGSGRWSASHEAFQDIFGLKSQEDWDRLEQEYKAHLNSALSKAPK